MTKLALDFFSRRFIWQNGVLVKLEGKKTSSHKVGGNLAIRQKSNLDLMMISSDAKSQQTSCVLKARLSHKCLTSPAALHPALGLYKIPELGTFLIAPLFPMTY